MFKSSNVKASLNSIGSFNNYQTRKVVIRKVKTLLGVLSGWEKSQA